MTWVFLVLLSDLSQLSSALLTGERLDKLEVGHGHIPREDGCCDAALRCGQPGVSGRPLLVPGRRVQLFLPHPRHDHLESLKPLNYHLHNAHNTT